MLRSLAFCSLLAAVSAANAQSADTSNSQASVPSQAAPIIRSHPYRFTAGQPRPGDQIVEAQPVAGVWLRSESSSALSTISATSERAEFRLDHGRLNVTVHHPADHAEVLVDLPGGQVSLFKDGLYTLNADTNTVRVLHGEAAAYPGPINPSADTKPIRIKEDHQLSLAAATGNGNALSELKAVESYPYELTADLLRPAYEDGPATQYGDGYPAYRYPYYAAALGYPGYYPGFYPGYYPGYYGYGYPFSYGIGFGYYGGRRFGGFRR